MEEKLEYGGFIEVTMEDMQNMHPAPTIGEVVQALECCQSKEKKCKECPLRKFGSGCLDVLITNSYNLVRRCLNDNKRMTREYERITYNKQEYLEWVDGFLRTHTVMKDRGEDYKMFDREWMCNTFWAKIESSLDYIIDLENQRNELQKQVDELKEELEKAYEIERANIQAEIAEAGTSCHWCKAKTEKDTAKEIIKWIKRNGTLEYGGYVIHDITIEQMCKKYDVEVE